MRFTAVILSALLCLSARAESAGSEKDSDEAIMAAAEKLVSEGKTFKTEEVKSEAATTETTEAGTVTSTGAAAAASAMDVAQEAKKESEIPVFSKSEKLVKSENSLLWRLVASLALVAVIGGSLIVAGRRWGRKKNLGGEKARIEILHQYHLGPKKSLALVRVAGEALLIGCTDQSINMLKSVTLIDDELEGILGKDFNGFLEDEFKVEDMRSAISSRA